MSEGAPPQSPRSPERDPHPFKKGDHVKVNLSPELLKEVGDMFDPTMVYVIEKITQHQFQKTASVRIRPLNANTSVRSIGVNHLIPHIQ